MHGAVKYVGPGDKNCEVKGLGGFVFGVRQGFWGGVAGPKDVLWYVALEGTGEYLVVRSIRPRGESTMARENFDSGLIGV